MLPHAAKGGGVLFGGNVFIRTGKGRLPIEQVPGPSIPEEMVKDAVVQAFTASIEANFLPRLDHEVKHLIDTAKAGTSL